MKTLVRICSVTALFASLCCVSSVYCEGLFTCEDTAYDSSDKQNILRSRYHLFQLFGDTSYRTTNFFEENYDGLVAWVENRVFFPRFSEFVNAPIPLPDPFFIQILKGLKDIDWEDRWDYGIGIEWRPLSKMEFPSNSLLAWTGHIRFYTVYLATKYLQDRDEWNWRPDDDFRIGAELYKECNLYNKSRYWGEFWADGSWRKTNFYIDDYESWTFAFVPKLGMKIFSDEEIAIMPYVTGEIVITERSEFWQNRALAGLGIRSMPFRWSDNRINIFVKGLRFYVETLWVVDYFRDEAPSTTPDYDFRIGVNFTVNWW